MDALCEALRRTKSKAEAAALIATWRAPVRRAKQLPLPMPKAPETPANDTLSREEQVQAGRGVLAAIEEVQKAGRP